MLDARDRPVEIEITPEMIEAGIEALALYDSSDSMEFIIRDVFQAMWLRSPLRNSLLPEVCRQSGD